MTTNFPKFVSYSDFKVENVVLMNYKLTQQGSKTVSIMYYYDEADKAAGRKLPLKILSPADLKTWGVGIYEGNANVNVPIDDSFPAEFKAVFENLDDKIVNHVFENSKVFFGAQKSMEIVKEFFSKTIRYTLDKNTGNVKHTFLKFKCPAYDGRFQFTVYDDDDQLIFPVDGQFSPESAIPKNSRGQFIFSVPSVWVTNGKFGYTTKIVQFKVKPAEESWTKACLIPKSVKAGGVLKENLSQVNDSEDEEEDFGVESENYNDPENISKCSI